jgi:hypothetical protein
MVTPSRTLLFPEGPTAHYESSIHFDMRVVPLQGQGVSGERDKAKYDVDGHAIPPGISIV